MTYNCVHARILPVNIGHGRRLHASDEAAPPDPPTQIVFPKLTLASNPTSVNNCRAT